MSFAACTTAYSEFVWPNGKARAPEVLISFAFNIDTTIDLHAAAARIRAKLVASEIRVELAYGDIYCYCVVHAVGGSSPKKSVGTTRLDSLVTRLSAWKNAHGVESATHLERVCTSLAHNNDGDSACVAFCAPGTCDEPHPEIVQLYDQVWLELQPRRQTLYRQEAPCSGVFACMVMSVNTLTASHVAGTMTRLKPAAVFSLNGSLHVVTQSKAKATGQTICFTPSLPHVVQPHGDSVFWCTPTPPQTCGQCGERKHVVIQEDAAFVCASCAPVAHIVCRDNQYTCLRARLLHLANEHDAANPLVLALPLNEIF